MKEVVFNKGDEQNLNFYKRVKAMIERHGIEGFEIQVENMLEELNDKQKRAKDYRRCRYKTEGK